LGFFLLILGLGYFKRDFDCGEWAGRKKERYCEKVVVLFLTLWIGEAKKGVDLFVWWGFAKGSRGAIWSQVDRGILVSFFFFFLVLRRGWTKRHWKEGNRSAQKILRINLPQKSRSRFFFLGFCFALCCFAKTLSFVKLLLSVEREREGEKRKKERKRERRECASMDADDGRRKKKTTKKKMSIVNAHSSSRKKQNKHVAPHLQTKTKKTHACFIKI